MDLCLGPAFGISVEFSVGLVIFFYLKGRFSYNFPVSECKHDVNGALYPFEKILQKRTAADVSKKERLIQLINMLYKHTVFLTLNVTMDHITFLFFLFLQGQEEVRVKWWPCSSW